jgi:ATP-binding cassette subfamily B protein RaxB
MTSIVGALATGFGCRLPSIRQSEAAECGLACLAMVATYHGLRTNLPSLRLTHPVSARGTTLNNMMVIANQLNLTPRALRVELDSLDQLRMPCILHWEMNHFVVLKEVTGGKFVIHDPARGVRSFSRSQISDKFTGVALELSPAVTFAPHDDRRRMRLKDFWTRITGLYGTLLQTLVLSAIIQLLLLAAPFYMQLVVDEVLTKFDVDLLLVLALGFGVFLAIRELTVGIRSWQILYVSSALDYNMGVNLARHLFRLPMTWFEKRHVGDVISRFSSTQAVRKLFAEGLVATVIDGVMAISTLIIMFIYSPLLASVVVAALTAYLGVRLGFYRSLRDRTEDEIVAKAGEQSGLIESIRAMQSIKIFGKEAQRQSYWQNRFADSINASVRLERLNIGFRYVNGMLFGIENVLVIYLGALAVIEGGFTVGMLFAFIAYKQHLLQSAIALIERLIEFFVLGVYLDRVADIALAPPESDTNASATLTFGNDQSQQSLVSFANCRFGFGTEQPPLLDDVSLNIRRGEFLTIVGPSGCGKSTLLKLILGLLKPDEGQVLYQGVPVSTIATPEYRQRFGTVMQDDMLLSGSIAENITFFDPAPCIDKIHHCAQQASIHSEIAAMPMGYNSLIGDMGSVLSAGQRQRILLARALYSEPEILILDEGTANLDPVSEQSVLATLSNMDITRICVTHGDRTIECSDRILMLHEAKLHALDKNQILSNRGQVASPA